MVVMAPESSWRAVIIRTALLMLFPAGLLALRFLRPHELADIRKFLAALRRSGEPAVSAL
jgi:hypothetical protein